MKRLVLFALCLSLAGAATYRIWDRYERGILYPWVEALIYPSNPFDGAYVTDMARLDEDPLADKIRASQDRGLDTHILQITQYRASLYGYLLQSPAWVGRGSLEVCLQADGKTLHLHATRWGAVRYCHHADSAPVLVLVDEGAGRLRCDTCTDMVLPRYYVRAEAGTTAATR